VRGYPSVDLHGLFANEAIDRLNEAIADAMAAGHERLLVVHGKGSGTLRREVRDHLKYHPNVVSFQFATVQEGGEGATVASLVARTSR
jgi:DNA mismatch repair protein MutS2